MEPRTPPSSRPPIDSRTVTRPRKTRSQLLREAKNVAVVLPEAKPESRKPSRPREGYARTAPPPPPPRRVIFNKPKPTKAMLARQAKAQERILEEQRKQAALEAAAARRRGPARRAPPRRSQAPRQAQITAAAAEILEESRHQAKSGNAEVVQAIPVGDGEIGTIIIPPGVISEDQTTIVQIVSAEEADGAMGPEAPASMNHSIQMISQSLNDQEAAEAAAVHERLDDFQQARRDFIMELASVTAPGLDPDLAVLDVDRLPLGEFEDPSPSRRKLVRVPGPDDDVFHLEHGRDHPAIVNAREFRRQKEQERRMQERFHRAAQDAGDFDLDAPLYQDILDADISFEEDEEGNAMPCRSRVKAPMPRAQRRSGLKAEAMYYPHSTMRADVEELERFFNIEKYPNIPKCRAPSGRDTLHPDLWELEDPWYREPEQPDVPDLMEFSR